MNEIFERFQKLSAKKTLLQNERRAKKKTLRYIRRDLIAHEKARILLTEVGKLAQQEIREKIESLLTLAIKTVFDRPLEFKLIFEEKRNHIEARPVVLEGENEYVPKDDMGGGILDIISFAFRLVLWQISNPRSRNIFILDEPFKFTGVLIERAGEMLKYLSKELNFQVLMVSHDDELIGICDRVYRINHNGKESVVKLIKGEGGRKIKRRGENDRTYNRD